MDFPLPAHNAARRRVSVHVTWRGTLFVLVVVAYLLLTLGVIFRSPVLSLDTDLVRLNLRHTHPEWKPWVDWYVTFGQRGPATLTFLPVFVWVAWRRHSTRPLVMLATSLILLNVTVGVVKLATGRVGPRQTHNTHDVFVGGDIYPSGHVSNAVVLYGLLAMLAINHRKIVSLAAAFLSITVGLGTVYLDTHWFSDVIGGWLAGALVLLVLPTVMPSAQHGADWLVERGRRRLRRRRGGRAEDGSLTDGSAIDGSAPVGRAAGDARRTAASGPDTASSSGAHRRARNSGTVAPVRIVHPKNAGQTEKVTPVSSEA